jgi:GTPase
MNKNNQLPSVVLFGCPNAGKSTLFNALCGKSHALVSDTPGTTRDLNVATIDWQHNSLEIVDTGGILDIGILAQSKRREKKTKNRLTTDVQKIDKLVQKKAFTALMKADLVVFLVDARAGLLPQDKELANFVKKHVAKEKIILVANKVDSPRLRDGVADFNKLGFGEPNMISATTGSGTGDLLDIIIKKLPPKTEDISHTSDETADTDTQSPISQYPNSLISNQINVAIIGKPNVGKSSLINMILGEEKIIVSPIAHTTREPNDTKLDYKGHIINLIDTAGISRSGQKNEKKQSDKNTLEKLSIQKSLETLNRADIAILVIDVKEGLTSQESKLAEEIINSRSSLIILANKWDLIKDKNTKKSTSDIYADLPFATWAPIQFVSALTGLKIDKVLDLVLEISDARKISISDNALSKFLHNTVKKHSPIKSWGVKKPYIHEIKQDRTNPPGFCIRIGAQDNLSEAYVRFIQKQLREKFGFLGTPIQTYVDRNKKVHGHNDGYENPKKDKKRKPAGRVNKPVR